jgi:hypothetical protein
MTMRRTLFCSLLGLSMTLVGCAEGGVRHGWIMRGQVLAIDNGVATVCVGTRDGAKPGQVLTVERITMKPPVSPKNGSPTFVRSDAGRVRITELFDEHYARAQIVSGNPAVNDVVELEM